jgi:hypothetical protein
MTERDSQEFRTLGWIAAGTVLWLVLIGATALIVAIALLSGWTVSGLGVRGALISVVGGTLGSSISALVSAAERVSHGWELSGGVKYPEGGPKDKFVARMAPFFIIRPFLGSTVGFLAYVGIVGGFLIAVENANATQFSDEGLLFITILTGLFAKTFLEKMRAAFDTLFGK